jgi:hypothetical protein
MLALKEEDRETAWASILRDNQELLGSRTNVSLHETAVVVSVVRGAVFAQRGFFTCQVCRAVTPAWALIAILAAAEYQRVGAPKAVIIHTISIICSHTEQFVQVPRHVYM